jgi:hypothetical protein
MPSALVFYHFFHPDDVVSAVHFTELCTGLRKRGWDVVALPCNRSCRDVSKRYPSREDLDGVRIRRVWRPAFSQTKSWGRIANTLWMLLAWAWAAVRYRPDLLIVGTDPVLSVLVALPWKWIRPSTKIVHWCFDMYPEAAIADGMLPRDSRAANVIRRLVRAAYAQCDLFVDIGPCMRNLAQAYQPNLPCVTLTPWALLEPARPLSPNILTLRLLYSGNFGRAHAFERTLQVARRLRNTGASFDFSVRGNCEHLLRAAVSDQDENIAFLPFVPKDQLEARLAMADIHIVSLQDNWTGAVVPSKFFGALAAGRPVLFEGSEDCCVAHWIKQFGVGWVLTSHSQESIVAELTALALDRSPLDALFCHCHAVYQAHFARKTILDAWDRELRMLCPSDLSTP